MFKLIHMVVVVRGVHGPTFMLVHSQGNTGSLTGQYGFTHRASTFVFSLAEAGVQTTIIGG